MKKIRITYTTKFIAIVSVLLLVTTALSGIFLVNQSQRAMKSLIDARLLDISNTAAAMLDGDTIAGITAEGIDGEDYRRAFQTLKHFQDHIDLKYIYILREDSDGNFVFVLDTDEEDPAAFGEISETTIGMREAGMGKATADDMPYSDRFGRFYSAYSPIWDSKGNVAGIVGVDFSADWYDAQIAKSSCLIAAGSLLSLLMGALLMFVVTGRVRKRFRWLTSELSILSDDVKRITKEIADRIDANRTAAEDHADADEIQEFADKIMFMRHALSEYISHVHTQANRMVSALSSDYRGMYCIHLDKGEGICYQSHPDMEDGLATEESFPYPERFIAYGETYVTPEYREEFLSFIDPANIRRDLSKGRILSLCYLKKRDDGQEAYEMLRIAELGHSEGTEDGLAPDIGMGFADVDAQMRRDMEQKQALSDALAMAKDASQAKTTFLSQMSHEIRTPMNAIIGLGRIAMSDDEVSGKAKEYLKKMDASANHLLSIINDILDMSRIESGRMLLRSEVFSFAGLIEKVNAIIGGQCRNKGLAYQSAVQGDPAPYYVGDETKLRQVLVNILGNAVKFTPEGGTVSFLSEVAARYDGKTAMRFTVSDTGIGMSEDFLPKIFEPFSQEDAGTTNRYGSTGLGMPITKSIVEMMNGSIEVTSEKGHGTTFVITVTFLDAGEREEEEGDIRPHELSVLIVDDDEIATEMGKVELAKAGISADTAHSGKEALRMVQLRHARHMAYHLILVDWKMPDMDGVATAKEIRSVIGNESAIIMITAYQWDDILHEALASGVDEFLAKPLDVERLLAQFRHTLRKRKEIGAGEPPKADLKGRRILVAEDMPVNAEIVLMMLQMREMEAEHAENGKIALEMFEKKPVGYYDAILMDMRMPEMDGLAASAAIRSLDRPDAKRIPIIALTANAFDEDVQRSLQAGLNAHLAKPVEPEALYETLESLIRDA